MSALNPAARPLEAARASREFGPLLAVAAPLALLAVALAVATPALTVQDLWLTLLSGREVAQHGLPAADHLTVIASGRHWVDQQWLAALVLYAAASAGGAGLAIATCVAAFVAAFGLAAHVAYRRGASPLAILLFVGAAVVSAPWGLQPRAQALALPLFALVLWLLVRDPRAERRWTLFVLPVLCVWANVHGSVVVGVALVVLYALRTRAWLYLLAPLTVLVSPYAPRLPGYYRLMLLDPPFGRYIKEWHRTTPSPLTACFFALALYAVVLVVRRRDRLDLFDKLVFALALLVALEAVRGLIWFALAILALLPALATRKRGAMEFGSPVYTAVAVAAIAGAIVVAAARPARAYEARIPSGLADVVAAHTGSGQRVFANDATADWLLWKLPRLRGRVAYDVRFEILTPEQIHRLLVWRSFGPGWQHAADGYALVVDDSAHVSRLVATGRWRRLVAGPRLQVAERVGRAR